MNETAASRGALLLVEDDFDIREALSGILRDEGYTVRGASNGAEALETLRRDPAVDLIVLDLMMPVMDGWAFRQIQREDPKLSHIPVLVLSADAGARERVQALGAVAFLRKPVQLDALLDAVAQYSLHKSR
jgi:CheY-like chemotaxis protein